MLATLNEKLGHAAENPAINARLLELLNRKDKEIAEKIEEAEQLALRVQFVTEKLKKAGASPEADKARAALKAGSIEEAETFLPGLQGLSIAEKISTRFGKLILTTAELGMRNLLVWRDVITPPPIDLMHHTVSQHEEFGVQAIDDFHDVVLFSEWSGAHTCGAEFFFVVVSSDGQLEMAHFGNCNDDIKWTVDQKHARIVFRLSSIPGGSDSSGPIRAVLDYSTGYAAFSVNGRRKDIQAFQSFHHAADESSSSSLTAPSRRE